RAHRGGAAEPVHPRRRQFLRGRATAGPGDRQARFEGTEGAGAGAVWLEAVSYRLHEPATLVLVTCNLLTCNSPVADYAFAYRPSWLIRANTSFSTQWNRQRWMLSTIPMSSSSTCRPCCCICL